MTFDHYGPMQQGGKVVNDQRHGYIRSEEKGVWEKVDRVTNAVVATFPIVKNGQVHTPSDKAVALIKATDNGWDNTDIVKKKEEKKVAKQKAKFHTHSAEKVIWQYGGRAFYAAGISGLHKLDCSPFAAIIDLADNFPLRLSRRIPFIESNIPGVQAALEKIPSQTLPLIKIDWPDGTGLPVGGAFWSKLWDLLPVGSEEAPAKILVCCFGAHGRTGTALASLMLASNDPSIFSPAIAICRLRIDHCEEAVETSRQLDYLDQVAGDFDLSKDAWDTYAMTDYPKELAEMLAEAEEEGREVAASKAEGSAPKAQGQKK